MDFSSDLSGESRPVEESARAEDARPWSCTVTPRFPGRYTLGLEVLAVIRNRAILDASPTT